MSISAGFGQKSFSREKGVKWETRAKRIKADGKIRKKRSKRQRKSGSKKGIRIRPFEKSEK
jgi:hypothetical protein